jgi:predicted secreted protein
MKQLPLVLRCVAAAVFLAVSQGCVARRSEAPRVTVVTEQTGGDVSLKVGAVLEVRLKSNFTKGYIWIAAPVANPVLMTQGKVPFEELVSGADVGAGGTEVWRFKAVKAGRQALRFKSCGPSEKSAPPAKVVTFSVIVE